MYQPKILSPYACRDSSGSYRRKTPLNTPNTVKPGGEHRECPYFKKKGVCICIKRVQFRENVSWAFFPQGQIKLTVIMRCPYLEGVRKAGCDCTS